jgi:hypothetical protein
MKEKGQETYAVQQKQKERKLKKSYQCLSYTTKLVEVVDPFYKECSPEADIHPRNFSSSQ